MTAGTGAAAASAPPAATFDGLLSPLNRRFRELARQDERLLRRSAFGPDIDRRHPLEPLAQLWPTFVGRRAMREMEEAALGISALIRSLPERLFGNDAQRLARYFGLDPDLVAATLAPPSGIAAAVARGDFTYTAAGFRCLEFNIASSIGSWQPQLVADLLLHHPPIADFVRGMGVRYRCRSTVRELLAHCIRETLASSHCDGRQVKVGIGMPAAMPAADAEIYRGYLGGELRLALREIDPALTGSLLLCPYGELHEENGCLYLRGERVDALFEWHSHGTHPLAFRCAKLGTLELFNGPSSLFLSDKRCLALLSAYAGDGRLFSAAEAAFIHRWLPWTRRLLPEPARYGGDEAMIPDLAIARQSTLVLKKGGPWSASGKDVCIGKYATAQRWADTLRRGLGEGDWIVQELAEPLPLLYQHGACGCCPHDVIWGPFVFGGTFAGIGLRLAPRPESGVISYHIGRARVGIVVEVEDDGQEGSAGGQDE